MKIIVMATGPFAIPTLNWLLASEHEVVLLVTRPTVTGGRRRKLPPTPVRDVAEQAGLEIRDPVDVNEVSFVRSLISLHADLLFVCDYGQLLSRDCLGVTKYGGVNLHGSLLPRYRGAAPIHWAIFEGETVTGVSIIHMTPRLDGGPLLASEEIEILADETTEQLEPRMAELGVTAFRRSIRALESWNGEDTLGQIQDPALATRAPQLKKNQGRIDWTRSAQQIANQIRAFQPWPGSFTDWVSSSGKAVRIILHEAWAIDQEARAEPGEIQSVDATNVWVATGQGVLRLGKLQPVGKQVMGLDEFLRGRPMKPGDRFLLDN